MSLLQSFTDCGDNGSNNPSSSPIAAIVDGPISIATFPFICPGILFCLIGGTPLNTICKKYL